MRSVYTQRTKRISGRRTNDQRIANLVSSRRTPGHTARTRQINTAQFAHAPNARTCFVPPGRCPVAITQATMGADDYPSWHG
jgi:hypothetical protein